MNAIQSLSVKNFTAFSKADFEFSPGINILIGENSTGKSHILKLIYGLLEMPKFNDNQGEVSKSALKLIDIFKPYSNKLESFRRKSRQNSRLKENLEVRLSLESQATVGFKIQDDAQWEANISFYASSFAQISVPLALFLPSREVLSIYPGFIAAYLNRETAFDETYYDLCVALNANPLRKEKYESVKQLIEPLEKVFGGENKVTKEGDHFFVDLPDAGQLEAQLVAEGYRKLASLVYLIRNGSLTTDSVLLWDEPEANLNPKLIAAVVEFLINLANAGVQIFIATHNYLFSQEISLRAEYGLNENIRFFSLYRRPDIDGVLVESGDTLAQLNNNPILDAYVAHEERENRLLYDESEAKGAK
ncbi:MAG: AAA family ATPase [Anaerolineae bacterium]|nr:AAA family ATPase [Anaerolineae bacterium]